MTPAERIAQRLGPALDADAALIGAARIVERFAVQLEQQRQPFDGILFALGHCIEERFGLVTIIGKGEDDLVLGCKIQIERALAHA